jgi:hypothetical protein
MEVASGITQSMVQDEYGAVMKDFEKDASDVASNPCHCCHRLFRKKQVS